MKKGKKTLKHFLRYVFSAALLSSILTYYTPAATQYKNQLVDDSFVNINSDEKSSYENYNDFWLTININVDGNSQENKTFYFDDNDDDDTMQVSLQIASKTGFVIDSETYGDENSQKSLSLSTPTVLTLNYYSYNTLTINLHTETKISVTQIHADGTSNTFPVFSLRDNKKQSLTLTPLDNELLGSIEISPDNLQDLVTRNGKTLTITGKSGIPALNITVNYRKNLQDTLQIQKQYGGKVDDGSNDFWLQFNASGSPQAQPIDVVLVLDRSGSMGYDNNQRMDMLKTALTKTDGFINAVLNANKGNRIAIADYSSKGYGQGLCRDNNFTNNKTQLNDYVNRLIASGGTQTDAGLKTALGLLNNSMSDNKKIVVLFTDGLPGDDEKHSVGEAFSANAQANAIKATGAEFYSISYIPDDAVVTWTEKNDNSLTGNAGIDNSNSDDIVTTPSSYPYVIQFNGNSTYTISPSDKTNNIHLPLIHQYYNPWNYSQKDFARAFLSTLATDQDHYYDSAGNMPLSTVLNKISQKITAVATGATITDILNAHNCHLNIRNDDTNAVQWRNMGDTSWQSVPTSSTEDIYYTITAEPVENTGGTIELHIKAIDATGIQIRFKAAPNDGVYSSDAASEDNPDLETNQSASISYTDILNNAKKKTSEAGSQYDPGLKTPKIYIPFYVLTIQKTIDKPYLDDSSLMNSIQPVQSFVFKIDHSNSPDFSKIDQTVYEVIRFGTGDSNTKSQAITGLQAGYYRVTEESDWSWLYDPTPCTDNFDNSNDGIVCFGAGNKKFNVSFLNNRKNVGWLSDSAAAVNKIN